MLSQLHAGSQVSMTALEPAIGLLEQRLALPPSHRAKIICRLDSGFGSDDNLEWLLKRGYQVLVKGVSNRRAGKLATQVRRWQPLRPDRWVGCVPTPVPFSRPVSTFVVRRQGKATTSVAYLYTTLRQSAHKIVALYDQRGGAETEFRADKSGGLHLHKRRKHKRDAMEVWIHLTDIAHNYLAWFHHHILADSPLAAFGPLRIARDLMHIPGHVNIANGQILSVKFSKATPNAAALLDCLRRFWQ